MCFQPPTVSTSVWHVAWRLSKTLMSSCLCYVSVETLLSRYRSAHGEQASGSMMDVEALNDKLQWHCSHVRREVEEPAAARTNPFTWARQRIPHRLLLSLLLREQPVTRPSHQHPWR